MPRIDADNLRALVSDIFAAAGCSPAESQRIAKYLVKANLVGHDSHGVARVLRYVDLKRTGQYVADQTVDVVVDTPVLAVLDGKYGFGQTIAPQAVEIGIAKCKTMGLAAVALRNSGHIGRVGDWAEIAAEANLVSIYFVNASGSVLVAPFGGVERRFSTAPYCVGVPRPDAAPIILDFATSVVAEGKVLVASQGGKKLRPDALVGPDGQESGDPHLLYGDFEAGGARDYSKGTGAIRAFGDHKGSGLALICELLGGSMTGTGAAKLGRRHCNGMFSIYVDPQRLDPDNFFPADLTRYVAAVKSTKPVTAGGEVLVPGEPEARTLAQRARDGIPLPGDTWAALSATARSVGLSEERIRRAAAVRERQPST